MYRIKTEAEFKVKHERMLREETERIKREIEAKPKDCAECSRRFNEEYNRGRGMLFTDDDAEQYFTKRRKVSI